MKNLRLPSPQSILLIIAAFAAALTWIIPAGQYDKLSYSQDTNTFHLISEGASMQLPGKQATLDSLGIRIPIEKFTGGDIYKAISVPGSYHKLEAKPQGIFAFLQSPVKGIIAASDIIFLILIIGGLIGIMNQTGAFIAGIAWISSLLKGREYLLIIIVCTLIALGGTSFGLAEETMAFYPILVPVFLAARYDAMTGLACIFLGSAIGTMCSTVNPFSAIIASDAAGINWTSGLYGRIVMLVICLSITIAYILNYARKVKRDPSKSLVYAQKKIFEEMYGLNKEREDIVLTARLKLILVIFSLSFIIMIIGVSFLGWWFVEMSSVFLTASIIIAFISKIRESVFIESFVKGASDLLGVAFIVGIARGISIIMEDGLISDSILYQASLITEGMNKGIFVNVTLYVYAGLSFFMPSSSGMAVLTMPIMSPLADVVGVGREIIVDCYMYGMGLFYLINPASLILAALAIVQIDFDKWLKFVMPLLLMLTLATMAFLTLSVYMF